MLSQIITPMVDWALPIVEQNGMWALAIFSYTESIFHPIPVDLVIVPLSALGTWSVWEIFFVAWIASLLGGSTAHYLGKKLGKPVFIKFFGPEMFAVGEKFLKHWGMWSVVIAAATPIPFKVMAWMAGILDMPTWKFFIAQAIGRGIRFAGVLWLFELIKSTSWYMGLF